MQIVINHLTRMQKGFFCVAGVDMQTAQHVRPVIGERLPIRYLACNDGPFDIGNIVDIGIAKPIGQKPQLEDHQFDLQAAYQVDVIEQSRFRKMLHVVGQQQLCAIFGDELTLRGRTSAAVDLAQGNVSLGVLQVSQTPMLYIKPGYWDRDQIRMKFTDGHFKLDAGVTDIRLYAEDHVTPDKQVIKRVQHALNTAQETFLSVGLSRPHTSNPNLPSCHWLQINNIHLERNPCWQLG